MKTPLSVDSREHFNLLNIVGALSMLAFPFILYYLYFLESVPYIISGIAGILLITKFGHAIGQHRYFSHNSFKTNTLWHRILAVLATLSCTGTIIHYSAIHRAHHRFSDTETDPHSSYYNGFIKTWFANLDADVSKKIPKKIVIDLMRDTFVRNLHEYYWSIILLYVCALFVLNPILVITMFILPVGYSRICIGMQATISHKFGYRNFSTTDKSTNSILINVLSLGEGSHNNHHYRQTEYNFGFTNKFSEFDLSAWLIKYVIKGKKYEH